MVFNDPKSFYDLTTKELAVGPYGTTPEVSFGNVKRMILKAFLGQTKTHLPRNPGEYGTKKSCLISIVSGPK